jgi:2,3-bisphosphoglycerate-independent phosphoglycerate mutase
VAEAYTREPRGDEFLEPIIFSHPNEQRIRDGDVVFWYNFRADRARQLSIAFLDKDFNGFDREVFPKVHYVTLTEYDKTYGCPVVFEPQSLANILGQVVSKAGRAIAHRGDRKPACTISSTEASKAVS